MDVTKVLTDVFTLIRDLQPLPTIGDRASVKSFALRIVPDGIDLLYDAIGLDAAQALCAAAAAGEITEAHIDAALDAAAIPAGNLRDWLKTIDWATLVKTWGPIIISLFLKTPAA